MTSLNVTPLLTRHEALGAKIVDFGGWALPINYGSQVNEHHAVRSTAGIFDVSHMTVSKIEGKDTTAFLARVLANDINKISGRPGKAMYSCLLNHQGGVIDDLIVYFLNDTRCTLVSNAATRDAVIPWLIEQARSFAVSVTEQPELALIAVQGPESHTTLAKCFDEDQITTLNALKRFQGTFLNDALFAGRTGYTGEDGFEFIGEADAIASLFDACIEAGAAPCGLGARDTLRLEAGMALYGHELDTEHTPIECGLNWTVDLQSERSFIGRKALESTAPRYRATGVILKGKGVLRADQRLFLADREIGVLTSGSFSPTIGRAIGLARLDTDLSVSAADDIEVEMRGKRHPVSIHTPPFVRNGKSCVADRAE